MPKLTRVIQKLFGSNASASEVTQFGSYAAGAPLPTANPLTIQALSQFLGGWSDAVLGDNSPALEDMNAIHLLYAYQLAYIFENGVPEWDSTTTYYKGGIVNVSGTLYESIADNNLGNAVTDPVYWLAKPGDSILPLIEAITEASRATRVVTATTLQDFIGESFILDPTDRVVLTNLTMSVDSQNAILSGSNSTGGLETETYLSNSKNSKPIEFSARYSTTTVFDVAVGTSTTQTHLTSASNRATEVYNGVTSFGWLVNFKRSSTSFPWSQADKGQRISITAASYGSDILITHSAISSTLPAPTSTNKYVFIAENISPIQRALAGGSYSTMTPSRIRSLSALSGSGFPSYLHSYWKMDEAAGGEPNFGPSGPTYDLTAMGAPTSVAGKVAGIGARAGMNDAADLFYVSLADSAATPYDSQTFLYGGWMKTGVTGIVDVLGGKVTSGPNRGWNLRIDSATGFLMAGFDGAADLIATSIALTDDQWHLVYMVNLSTSGATNFRLYVDNVNVGSFTGQSFTPAPEDLGVGVTLNGGAVTFTGAMTLWEFWDSVPGTWAEVEAILSQRWNGGFGTDYGNNSFSLFGNMPAQSAVVGDRFGLKVGVRREITTVNPAALESFSAVF